jgi:hypothetical protein
MLTQNQRLYRYIHTASLPYKIIGPPCSTEWLYECLRRNRQRSCSHARNTIRSLKLSVLHAVLAFSNARLRTTSPLISSHASLLLLLCYSPSACPSVFLQEYIWSLSLLVTRPQTGSTMSLSISRKDAQILVQRLGTCRTRYCTSRPATGSNFCNIRE